MQLPNSALFKFTKPPQLSLSHTRGQPIVYFWLLGRKQLFLHQSAWQMWEEESRMSWKWRRLLLSYQVFVQMPPPLPRPLHLNCGSPFSPGAPWAPPAPVLPFSPSISHHLMYCIFYLLASPIWMWPPWGQGFLSSIAVIASHCCISSTKQCLALSRCLIDIGMNERASEQSKLPKGQSQHTGKRR